MQFINNKEQREVILQGLTVDKRDIISDTVRGLNHLHEMHIGMIIISIILLVTSIMLVHRDVKPSNILLVQRNPLVKEIKAVIADFGIATEIDFDRYLKVTTRVRGTRIWIAPELIKPKDKKPVSITVMMILINYLFQKFSKAVDVFSMGCVMYYVLSDGQHPLGDEVFDIITYLMNYGTHSLTLHGISDEVENREPAKDLIMQMMHKNKDLR